MAPVDGLYPHFDGRSHLVAVQRAHLLFLGRFLAHWEHSREIPSLVGDLVSSSRSGLAARPAGACPGTACLARRTTVSPRGVGLRGTSCAAARVAFSAGARSGLSGLVLLG